MLDVMCWTMPFGVDTSRALRGVCTSTSGLRFDAWFLEQLMLGEMRMSWWEKGKELSSL